MTNTLESGLMSARSLVGKRAWIGRPKKNDPDATKKMGRVRACVFHPKQKRFVGLLVKRPDVALMFHRADLFVAVNGFTLEDGAIMIGDSPQATDRGACKALGIRLDDCVLWLGLAVLCEDGTHLGVVGDVLFHPETGAVESLLVSRGATANALLGTVEVPANQIRGFRRGMGSQLYMADDDDAGALGCILVSDEMRFVETTGGAAEKAGAATAVAADKAKRVVRRVKPQAQAAVDAAKPAAQKAAKAASEAVDKGAFATGRQLGRASGMFGAFAEEFKNAMRDED